MNQIKVLRLFLSTLMLWWSVSGWSQTHNLRQAVDSIKASDDYLWGEGFGSTDGEADQQALVDLSSKIIVKVSGQFDLDQTEINDNGQIDAKNVMRSKMQTYTSTMLPNAGKMRLSMKPEFHVFRFVSRSDVSRFFADRERRARDFVCDALDCEKRGRIDDALRCYYWALCLVKGLQYPTRATYNDHGRERVLLDWIPLQMDDIFDNLHAEVSFSEGNRADLLFTYKGAPPSSVEFNYYTGQGYRRQTAKGGIASIVLPDGMDASHINVKYEYEFKGRMNADDELESVMNILKPQPMAKSEQIVHCGNKKEQRDAQVLFQQKVVSTSAVAHSVQVERPKEMAKVMARVLKAVREKQYTQVADCFTPDGYKMFNQLLNYGKARIMGSPQLSFWGMGERTVCRSVPMSFSFRNNHREFTENVTFTFNAEGRIESLAFALDQVTLDDIFLKERPAWNDSVRMVVATFLENYQTAYALKRADYIESLFAEDALIITGCVLRRAPKTRENSRYLENEYVKMTQLSKSEYMARLRKCMNSNEYINIHFSETDVRMADMTRYPNMYGILLQQNYYSSSYADNGYLFLLVDMNNVDQPTILVRTWQPRRDYSINSKLAEDSPYRGLINGINFK